MTSRAEQSDEVLEATLQHVKNYLHNVDSTSSASTSSSPSVASTVDLTELRHRFAHPLPRHPTSPKCVIDELVRDTSGGLLGSAGGRFYAWVVSGGLSSALAADWLTATWDQNAALYACSPAASVVEEVAGMWLKTLFGLPVEASFAFTTGCQMAHFTCLAAARFAVLKARGWDVNEDGLFGAPAIRVIGTDQRHATIDRSLRYLGLGNRCLVSAPTDANGMVNPEAFKALLEETSNVPTIVVLDAADLNIAAVDPFTELIPMAHACGAWVHIDGAFGLFAAASESKRHLVRGIELADSWATDGHKWLNVPFDCGFAFVRDVIAHKSSMTVSASYIVASSDDNAGCKSIPARDQIDWNPEWSRRARGFPVYAALRELGSEGVQDLVDRCCKHCYDIVVGIGALPSAEVLWTPTLNQGLVRFLDLVETSEESHNKRTNAVLQAVNAGGKAFFSGTTWRGKYAMRVSVVNWRTSAEDVAITIEAVKAALLQC